jgi:hypothetical protein
MVRSCTKYQINVQQYLKHIFGAEICVAEIRQAPKISPVDTCCVSGTCVSVPKKMSHLHLKNIFVFSTTSKTFRAEIHAAEIPQVS